MLQISHTKKYKVRYKMGLLLIRLIDYKIFVGNFPFDTVKLSY